MIAYNLEDALAAPDQVQSLVLYRRSLTTWPDALFRLKRLTHLELDQCEINHLDDRLKLLPLHTLKLPRNAITEIPSWFPQLLNLQHLDLTQNSLTSFPADRIPPHLIHCTLTRNRLVQFPVEKLLTLELLDLRRNPLSRMKWPDQHDLLREVYLEGSPTAAERLFTCRFPQLQTLHILRSKVQVLPSDWPDRFPRLQHIDLSSNRLVQLPDSFSEAGQQWQRLNLSKNRLTVLPQRWASCPHLRLLNLSRNQLTGIPPGLSQLPHLTRLNLSGNPLESLPDEFASHPRLQVLDLKNTGITHLAPGPWLALEKLSIQGTPMANREDLLRSLPSRIRITGKKRMDTPGNLSLSVFRQKAGKAGWTSAHQARIWKLAEGIVAGRKEKPSVHDHLDLWTLGLPEYPESLIRLSPGRKLPAQGRLFVFGRTWLPTQPLAQRAKGSGITLVSSGADHPNMILLGGPLGDQACLHPGKQTWWSPAGLMELLPPLTPGRSMPEGKALQIAQLLRSGLPIYQAIARQDLQDHGIPQSLYGELLLIIRKGLIPQLRKEWPGLIVRYGQGDWVVDCLSPKKDLQLDILVLADKWNISTEALAHWMKK